MPLLRASSRTLRIPEFINSTISAGVNSGRLLAISDGERPTIRFSSSRMRSLGVKTPKSISMHKFVSDSSSVTRLGSKVYGQLMLLGHLYQ